MLKTPHYLIFIQKIIVEVTSLGIEKYLQPALPCSHVVHIFPTPKREQGNS